MALFLFLVFVSFSPVLAQLEQRDNACTQSTKNQCQDLKVAIQCRTVRLCLKTKWRQRKVKDDTCNTCKTFMREIVGMGNRNSPKDALKAALHKGCDSIPIKELKDQCNNYVDSYLSIIIQLLEKEVKPHVVCAALGLCKSREHKNPSTSIPEDEPDMVNQTPPDTTVSRQFQGPLPKGVFSCEFCLRITQKLKHLLPEEKTEKSIAKVLSKICSFLPDKLLTRCNNFMNKIGKSVVELLYKKIMPGGVCDTLHFCSTDKRTFMLPIMSCNMCENVVHQLKSARKQGTEVDVLLPKACNSYSDASKLVCEDFIHSHKAQLSNLLQNQEDKDLCGELDFCVRKVEAVLLGRDECTWAPSHWCQTWESATRCKNVALCQQLGWKYDNSLKTKSTV
ncbi:prosaposin-like [Carcharodon carcharias]|uniref:prosaposin-like n=1 Tax=Carcharodon carcharias TaxID=13397 RepID=UPI001B7E7DC9|nr:prosaposin-like [Carcharodon carcharias]